MEVMRKLASTIHQWLTDGHDVVIGRVMSMDGFGGRRTGEALAVSMHGAIGSLAMGAANAVAIDEAHQLLHDPGRETATVSVPVGDREAVAAGLACGGTAHVLLQRANAISLSWWLALQEGEDVALATDPVSGEAWVATLREFENASGSETRGVTSGGSAEETATKVAQAKQVGDYLRRMLTRGPTTPHLSQLDGRPAELFFEAIIAVPNVVVFGEAALATAIHRQAALLGWTSSVFSDATTISAAEAVAAASQLRSVDGVVVLSHNVASSSSVLAAALRGRCGYVGALGSRHTQGARRAELLGQCGLNDEQVGRIHGPVGLDLGSRTPEETSLAIAAEMLSIVRGRSAATLTMAPGPING
jgi:xanthine dehydrogenase accessory factor